MSGGCEVWLDCGRSVRLVCSREDLIKWILDCDSTALLTVERECGSPVTLNTAGINAIVEVPA